MWRLAEGGRSAAEAARLVHTALDAGITLLDTADIYGFNGTDGFGDAEALLGEVLAAEPGLRARMVLASKGGIMPPPYDQSADYLNRADARCAGSRPTASTSTRSTAPTFSPTRRSRPRARRCGGRGQGARTRRLLNFTCPQVAALNHFLDNQLVATQPEISSAGSPASKRRARSGDDDGADPAGLVAAGGGRLAP